MERVISVSEMNYVTNRVNKELKKKETKEFSEILQSELHKINKEEKDWRSISR